VHPPSAYRDAEMRAGQVLFRLWGVPWTVTSRSWQFLALGLVTLGLWLELGGHLPLFAAVLNFLLGAFLLLPLPGADGEVIWRAIQRR
jgi:hypothetical protein